MTMGFWNWLFGTTPPLTPMHEPAPEPASKTPAGFWLNNGKLKLKDLYQRLGVEKLEIIHSPRGVNPRNTDSLEPHLIPLGYQWHKVPKRSGEMRLLHSPNPRLKAVQKKLLRRVFARLKVHPAAMGFRRGISTMAHAALHVNKAVVIRIDIRNFFPSIRMTKIMLYLQRIGWDVRSSTTIATLCCRKGRLPQGAPTSPILSNLVNYRMDARLAGLARRSKATYSRYADDLIFSFDEDNRRFIRGVIRRVSKILYESGYQMNRPKLRVMRRHNRQTVTGLVVNQKVQLPRKTRRWLRAVEHHLKHGQEASLTREQLAGWKAYQLAIAGKKSHPR
jgi:RNA-directed DNA polymerase